MSTNESTVERADEQHVLEAAELTRQFGELVAVDDVDFAVEEGAFHSIIGPNGAGKTTFFDLITGRLSPTDGAVYFRGEEITDYSQERRAAMGISRTFQITQLFNDLTVIENLKLAAQSIHQSVNPLARRDNAIIDRSYQLFNQLQLEAEPSTVAKTLSHGEKKRLEIGMSLATDPEMLLLDEPTSGLSGKDSQEVMELLERLTSELTVLLIEHDMDVVLNYSDVITVLHQGMLIAEGDPEEITANDEVQRVYLGGYE